MSSTRRKFIAALAVASATALSTDTAEAWGGSYYRGAYGYRPSSAFAYRPYAANFTYRPPYAYRSYYGYQPSYAYRPAAFAYMPRYLRRVQLLSGGDGIFRLRHVQRRSPRSGHELQSQPT